MGVGGEPATTVTVTVENGSDDPVHITVTDANQDPVGLVLHRGFGNRPIGIPTPT